MTITWASSMAKVYKFGPTVIVMKDAGRMIKCMVEASTDGLTEQVSKANGRTV